jgi:hypothetical protein
MTSSSTGALAWRDPDLGRAIPVIEARLQVRFPDLSSDRIRRCVNQAVARSETAKVRNFLPILVERWATAAAGTSEQITTA